MATAPSVLELLLLVQIQGARPALPPVVAEHQFARPRRWRFDFCFPSRMVAVEVDGGVWSSGRHVRGAGYSKDIEKLNTAAALGWRVFRFTGEMVNNGSAITVLREVLK